jgi:hypothetical protein
MTAKVLEDMMDAGEIVAYASQQVLSQVAAYDSSEDRSGKAVYAHLWRDLSLTIKNEDGETRQAAIEADGPHHTRASVAAGYASTPEQIAAAKNHRAGAVGIVFDRDISKEQRLLQNNTSVLRITNVRRPTALVWRASIKAFVAQCKSSKGPIFVVHDTREYKEFHNYLSTKDVIIPQWRQTMRPLENIQHPKQRISSRFVAIACLALYEARNRCLIFCYLLCGLRAFAEHSAWRVCCQKPSPAQTTSSTCQAMPPKQH